MTITKQNTLMVICAICNQPVERLVVGEDIVTMTRRYTAYCHGDRDSCDLPETDLYSATIQGATAFTTKRIGDTK